MEEDEDEEIKKKKERKEEEKKKEEEKNKVLTAEEKEEKWCQETFINNTSTNERPTERPKNDEIKELLSEIESILDKISNTSICFRRFKKYLDS